jgi:hypothetical protein
MESIGKHRTAGAVLAIMVRSGAIADFELHEFGNELFVRIWPHRDSFDLHLRKQIAALLPRDVEERHVTIVEHGSNGWPICRADPPL